MSFGIIIAVAVFAAIWFLSRYARPEFPPLGTSPDDPLMVEAREKAVASIPEFMGLLDSHLQDALVKLRFVSNTGVTEYLWAEVLEKKNADELGVRLVTPPVTHTGQLDRLYTCKLSDLEDWQVIDGEKRHGAFTQRAMYKIARREGVKLPRKLAEAEKYYQ